MLKSEMQHQFWITKKTVQRRLGSKEDEHIISSDAELDSKIEIFKSISDTSASLNKVIDQYQERLCILSQEKSVFGRFLKEVGKRSKTTGTSISNTGKAISYSGQQMTCVRVPLIRLQHEVDVFRIRAVRDTQDTIQSMEKERTEYRAALSWIKSVSSALDPDSGKGLDKFRAAQSHVRASKLNFDSYALNTIQKIDLLAAARCNMYSHALMSYIKELTKFVKKTGSTFETISNSLILKPKYDFCVLKDLTQDDCETPTKFKAITTVDNDQNLYFAKDYGDDIEEDLMKTDRLKSINNSDLISVEATQTFYQENADATLINNYEKDNNYWSKVLPTPMDFSFNKEVKQENSNDLDANKKESNLIGLSKDSSLWIELFADMDPLVNQELIPSKLGQINFQKT